MLKNEEPGEFRPSPEIVNVPDGSTVTIQGQGGFKPYTYEKSSGSGVLDASTGEYATGGVETAEIRVTDRFGQSGESTINVFEPLTLTAGGKVVSQITIDVSDTVDFLAAGGPAGSEYDYYIDDILDATSTDGQWTFSPSAEGTYIVAAFDDLDNSAVATVTVVAGELAIDPTETYVLQGAAVSFTGLNVSGTAVYADDPAAGSFVVTGDDAEYTAPASTGAVIVTLTDDVTSVTATVHVLASDPDPLMLSPSSAYLSYGDEATFAVSGGVPPYTFRLEYDAEHGTLEQISEVKALYTAPQAPAVNWVWVEDSIGSPPQRAKVQVKKK